MIDFSTVKGIEFRNKAVKQISDAQGNVLWSAVTDPVITIKRHSTVTGTNSSYANVTINGVVYDGSQEVTLVLPVGTIIACYVGASISSYKAYDKDGNIKAQNGIMEKGTFNYEVVSNSTIEVGAKNQQYVGWQAEIIITET